VCVCVCVCVSTVWFMVCRWPQSQEGDWARPHLCKLARHGPWPVRKRFVRDRVWRGRWKPGCRIVGSVTIVWSTTEADDQSSLHCVIVVDRCHVGPYWASRCKPWRWDLWQRRVLTSKSRQLSSGSRQYIYCTQSSVQDIVLFRLYRGDPVLSARIM